jgi:sodium transport system permease protein
MYDSESIMFGDSGKELKIFERRANIKAGGTPGTGDSVIILLVCIISMFYISSAVASKSIILATALPQIFFAVICLASAFYLKCDIRKTFSLKVPSVFQIMGGFSLGIAMIAFNIILSSILSLVMQDSLNDMNSSMEIITEGNSFTAMLILIGFLPAVCEEILFRGYLYSSVKRKFKPLAAMIIVSVIFGLYHMNLIQSTVTAIIGMMFVFAVYRTDCIFISMIMHCMNNSFSVVCMYFPENTVIKLINNDSSVSTMIILILIGIIFSLLGIYLTKQHDYN